MEEGRRRAQTQRVRSEHRNRASGIFGTQDMAGELLEVSLERLTGDRALRSQILRERDPLKVPIRERTWFEEVLG